MPLEPPSQDHWMFVPARWWTQVCVNPTFDRLDDGVIDNTVRRVACRSLRQLYPE
jgi:hypothetical protein